ncbi:MAG: alternative ribosome rescue aminoacyl-tRNA hydrolase ArfB [Hyphomicrobiaceae bacterium]
MIRVTDSISLDPAELEEDFIRASGPGGQNVNKVASAVQLRFNARKSPNLPYAVKLRLEKLAGQRLTKDGVIVIEASRHRSQVRNRADAQERLVELIQEAAIQPKSRRPTKPTFGSKQRRLEGKKLRSGTKALRQRKPDMD